MEPITLTVNTRKLAVYLPDAELLAVSQELAATLRDLSAEEDSQKEQKEQMKLTLTELTSRVKRLSITVNTRTEWRDVEVAARLVEHDGKQMVEEVRLDTGIIIATRPPRDDERQTRFPTQHPDYAAAQERYGFRKNDEVTTPDGGRGFVHGFTLDRVSVRLGDGIGNLAEFHPGDLQPVGKEG